MKKFLISFTVFCVLLMAFSTPYFSTPYFASPSDRSAAIQKFLDDACRESGVPGMSVSVLYNGETLFFSSGFANREEKLPANENTLYELASDSKAFTGVGILLLAEQGLVSMSDPIQKYLPWLTFQYQGKPVDMQTLTLANFLHHTTGLTNNKHIQSIPQGTTPDMLQKTVEGLVDAELEFAPGEKYSYGTVNYDVLGLVIESLSGQSYEEFMEEQVLKPLGLYQTYVFEEDALATGQLAQGYRTSFFTTFAYDAPDYRGNKPAGYLISSSKDMARWMGIQMGLVQDIPEIFKIIIPKSHLGDTSVPSTDGMMYAAGWNVNSDQSIIEHAGQNPNFANEIVLLPQEKTAICLLSNGQNTNIALVKNIKAILDGDLSQKYKMSGTQILDICLSIATFIICSVAILLLAKCLFKKKQIVKHSKKRLLPLGICVFFTLSSYLLCFFFPALLGYTWAILLVWITHSLLALLVALALLSTSITLLVYRNWRLTSTPR